MNAAVTGWLEELEASPSEAIHKLVLGYAGVSAWSRSSLRESFVEIFQTHPGALDAAVQGWLETRLMTLPPENTPTVVWASDLQDLFSALAGLPLPRVAGLLRERLRDFRTWLRPLRTDENIDPEASYLAALAWAGTNQDLGGMWQRLALRRGGEPAYYTDIGLLGLRKSRDESGQLPPKPPILLLTTVIDLADSGMSQKDWLLTTRALLGGYHYGPETWVREFEPALATRPEAKHAPEWLKKVLPPLPSMNEDHRRYQISIAPAHSLQETDTMVADVAAQGPEALKPRLSQFLERERLYANTTRNPHFLVRTFNRLAEAALTHDPAWAVARAEESIEWDPDHEFCWTALGRSLWANGRRALASGDPNGEAILREAIDVLWQGRLRFPWNAYMRTELGKLVRMSGDLDTAEQIYREAIDDFPGNPWCLTGLADLLLQRQAVDLSSRTEARVLFESAAKLGDHYARRRIAALALVESEPIHEAPIGPASVAQMRPAQRLGRAILAQWEARHVASARERERHFMEAATLLDLPDELTGECYLAFVEARGFLLLAQEKATEARSYFEHQLAVRTNRSLGLRLGFAEARARLGEILTASEEEELASFGPEGSILPLVLKVVRLLESNDSDDALRELLLELYPRVRDLASLSTPELSDESFERVLASVQPKNGDTMMAQLLLLRIFRPAAIETQEDLRAAGRMGVVRASLKSQRAEILSVAEELALAA